MKIIIESGATKGDWRLISETDGSRSRILTKGTNVSTMPMSSIRDIIHAACKGIVAAGEKVSSVHMYTAGVLTPEISDELTGFFVEEFGDVECDIQTDLTGAARAACGHEAGIAAILGTGSNSCQFDGTSIEKRVYSSGFILGDEGSAATLGKLFVADFLKGLIPEYIAKDFSARYETGYAHIVENVYRSSGSPSGYLGSFAPFIMEYYEDPHIKNLVDGNFRAFIRRSVKQYEYERFPVGVVGGFGYALKDIFQRIADEEGIRISGFIKDPIEELIKYHITDSGR